MADIEKIVDSVKNMSVMELNDLVTAIEEEFGVSASAVMSAPVASGDAAGAQSEKTEFTVHLKEVGAKKMDVIKAVKEVLGLGLKDAKGLVDAAPKDLKENVPDAEAQEIKKKLEEAGAVVEIK